MLNAYKSRDCLCVQCSNPCSDFCKGKIIFDESREAYAMRALSRIMKCTCGWVSDLRMDVLCILEEEV